MQKATRKMAHFELTEKYNIYFRSVKTTKKLEEWQQNLCQRTLWKQEKRLKAELFIVYVSYMYTAVSRKVVYKRGEPCTTMLKVVMGNGCFTVQGVSACSSKETAPTHVFIIFSCLLSQCHEPQ